MSSRELENLQEEYVHENLASELDISVDELNQLQWDIDTNESNDGFIYEYLIVFEDDSPPEILDKIRGLDSDNVVRLSHWDFFGSEDESEIQWDIGSSDQLKIFEAHLDSVNKLLTLTLDVDTQFNLLVMLHAHIVAAIESYLSSTFIHQVTNSEKLTRKVIETTPEFGKRKFTLNNIYQEQEMLKVTVATYLKDIIFHNLSNVNPMYRNVINFDLGKYVAWLSEAIQRRHDCTHRAGYNKKGEKIDISVNSIKKLMQECEILAHDIDDHISKI